MNTYLSATFVNSVIGESVEVSAAPLTETYVVSASATNVVRDLDSALALSQQIDSANFGTVKKTSTKLDSEVDPKTGAETTMVTLETETEDEVSDTEEDDIEMGEEDNYEDDSYDKDIDDDDLVDDDYSDLSIVDEDELDSEN